MAKVKLGKKLPPMALPVVLVGSTYKGKANFCTIAWMTIIDDEPPTLGLLMGKKRRTKDGMVENGTFSVSIPDTKMVEGTDYCGITSGARKDKSKVFDVFYGDLGTAPLISEAPVTVECKLKDIIAFEGTDLVLGEVNEVYVDKKCVAKGKFHMGKIDPLLYGMGGGPYYSIGVKVADAFSVGKRYKPK
ncbi:MAG TPA: flavin reductase family protein [Methanomassiliicoccales archaeon]|nr:flavin reductase family protein [Methanomassiliicoccales archaeon]